MTPTARVPATYRLTFEDWLHFPDDGKLYEILGGELFVSPTPSWRHQLILTELLFRLRNYLGQGSRGRVASAPAGVRLSDEDIVEPDLVVILEEHRDRIDESSVAGTPDLVVEILSPGTAGRDLGVKRALYEQAGVPEYWIVDPQAETIQVLALARDAYREAALCRRGDTLLSPLLPGLEISVAEIFSSAEPAG
jgi:Uma2 family endonuclease